MLSREQIKYIKALAWDESVDGEKLMELCDMALDGMKWQSLEAKTPSGADCHRDSPHASVFALPRPQEPKT